MIKVRFHLAKGANFRKWQVKYPDGTVQYYEPSEVTLYMRGCKLHNNPNMAQKIYDGANKDVCAWVAAEAVDVVVLPIKNVMENCAKVLYNPKVSINWRLKGKNVDGAEFDELFTNNRFIIKAD